MVTGVEQDDAASDAVATSGSSGAGASSSGSSGGITVTTADGGNFTAHYALLTVSLGVLKEGDLDFQPPLPPSKLQAIEEMVGGRVGRGRRSCSSFQGASIRAPHASQRP